MHVDSNSYITMHVESRFATLLMQCCESRLANVMHVESDWRLLCMLDLIRHSYARGESRFSNVHNNGGSDSPTLCMLELIGSNQLSNGGSDSPLLCT